MNLLLKNVKYIESLSQETPAFTATLFDNGEKIADIKNDGHGGSTVFYRASSNINVDEYDNLEVEAKIFDMVMVYDFVSKNQRKAICLKNGDKLGTIPLKTSINLLKKTNSLEAVIFQIENNYPDWKIINRNI